MSDHNEDTFSSMHQARRLSVTPTRTAVLVVDMVNDFCESGGAMVLPQGPSLYRPLTALIEAARQAGACIVWVCDRHSSFDREFDKRVPHCLEGTWGSQIVDALPVAGEDQILIKRRYSAFFETDLDLRLREREIRDLVVVGVAANICVRSTVHDAFFRGYNVVVPADCVAATSLREQESTLHDIDTHFGTVCSSSDALTLLGSAPASEELA